VKENTVDIQLETFRKQMWITPLCECNFAYDSVT